MKTCALLFLTWFALVLANQRTDLQDEKEMFEYEVNQLDSPRRRRANDQQSQLQQGSYTFADAGARRRAYDQQSQLQSYMFADAVNRRAFQQNQLQNLQAARRRANNQQSQLQQGSYTFADAGAGRRANDQQSQLQSYMFADAVNRLALQQTQLQNYQNRRSMSQSNLQQVQDNQARQQAQEQAENLEGLLQDQ